MAAEILADDGIYKLRFVPSRKRYVAGCHDFTYAQAVEHWERRVNTGNCGCTTRCVADASPEQMDRAKLFLKAIKAHAAEQSQ